LVPLSAARGTKLRSVVRRPTRHDIAHNHTELYIDHQSIGALINLIASHFLRSIAFWEWTPPASNSPLPGTPLALYVSLRGIRSEGMSHN
jgi:hypothetical protein